MPFHREPETCVDSTFLRNNFHIVLLRIPPPGFIKQTPFAAANVVTLEMTQDQPAPLHLLLSQLSNEPSKTKNL